MWSAALGIVGKVAGVFGLSQLRVWFTIGAVVAATAFIVTVYVKGQQSVRNAEQLRNLQEQNIALERLYAVTRQQAQQMAQEAEANETKVRELEEYVKALPDRDAECLSLDDVERLQDLIGR